MKGPAYLAATRSSPLLSPRLRALCPVPDARPPGASVRGLGTRPSRTETAARSPAALGRPGPSGFVRHAGSGTRGAADAGRTGRLAVPAAARGAVGGLAASRLPAGPSAGPRLRGGGGSGSRTRARLRSRGSRPPRPPDRPRTRRPRSASTAAQPGSGAAAHRGSRPPAGGEDGDSQRR